VSAANNQENYGGVKVLRKKDESKNKNEKKITEEVEDLQKEGKVEVQLIAGKPYFQIKKT
jgi:hypothetical protein